MFNAFLKSLMVSPRLLSVCTLSLYNCSWHSSLFWSVVFSQKRFLQHFLRNGRRSDLVFGATATRICERFLRSHVVAGSAHDRSEGDWRSSSLQLRKGLPAQAPGGAVVAGARHRTNTSVAAADASPRHGCRPILILARLLTSGSLLRRTSSLPPGFSSPPYL